MSAEVRPSMDDTLARWLVGFVCVAFAAVLMFVVVVTSGGPCPQIGGQTVTRTSVSTFPTNEVC